MLKYLSSFSSIKHILFLLAFNLISTAIFAQQAQKPYTLLWRISGKDLKQPSYLFGTMHVKDQRVFNFSDSVMLAIQKCNGFALEVHPDSIMRKMFEVMQKKDSTRDLHKLLGEKKYAELAKKFEQKNGYKMREGIDPLMAESVLHANKEKPGDKESFIDAHLYGIARTMDKNIYGLEDASEQFDKVLGSSDAMRERLLGLLETGGGEDDSEAMIKIYSTGNLDNILSYIKKFDIADSELVARNHVMVTSMIKDMQKGSLFTAVGAAHLPGDNGIISQLQQGGYAVVPVPATFTGVAARYHIDYNRMKWVTHTDTDLGYSLDFPSAPIKTSAYAGLDTWMFADLANENFYGIYAIPKGTTDNPAEREKVIDNVIKNFVKNKKDQLISRKNTTINGLPGVDIVVKNATGYQRSMLIVANNVLYYVYMGNHLSNLHSAYANHFFNSFKALGVVEKPTKEWINFKNDTAALSIQLPAQPTRVVRETANPNGGTPFNIKMYVSTDSSKLMSYLIRYNDYPAGNYLADRNTVLNSIAKEFSSKAKLIGEPTVIWKDGYEGREVKLVFAGSYHSIVRIYIRGNRLYLLLKQNLHEGADVTANDSFFNSFKFEPYLKPTFVDFAPEGDNYRLKTVSTPKLKKDSVRNYKTYLQNSSFFSTTSPTSGGVYTFEHATISKLYRSKGVDSLYQTLTNLVVKYRDTLIKVDTITMNGKKARELITANRTTKDQRRSRILIDDGDVFFMESYLGKEQLFDDESNTFYNSLERTGAATKIDPYSSKAGKISEGLQSSDTTQYNEALGALSYYSFTTDELPFVYSALQKTYPDDTISKGVRYKLIEALRDTHDNKTIENLQTLYKTLTDKYLLKSIILNTIPSIDTKSGYDIYFNLLINDKALKTENNYMTFRPLYDSIKYTAAHFKQIVPLISNAEYRSHILRLSNQLLDSPNNEYTKLIRDNFKDITKYAKCDLDTFLVSKDTNKNEWATNSYQYLTLMGKIKGEPEINSYTNYYLNHYPKGYYVSAAVVARIYNGLPVGAGLTARLLDSMDSRYDIMEAYYRQKQLNKVPLKYKTPSEFGKLCLYRFASSTDDDDDYGVPGKISLLGSITEKGSIYYVYQFNFPEKSETDRYIGIAGPYKPGSSRLNFERYNAYTSYDVKTTNWIKQARLLIPDLKKAYQVK